MRAIPPALQAKIDSGVTTLARCWVVTRRDGVVSGFTDHDGDLVVEGVTCRAGTGFNASEATNRFDLSIDGAEISGALAADSLTEADLAAGRFDAAQVDTWLVDWSDVSLRVLLSRATLGEVKREGEAFSAELRGLADKLSQESGRLYTARCTADLGDARCKIALAAAGLNGAGNVSRLLGVSAMVVEGLGDFAEGVFTAGCLTWMSGANSGLAVEIKEHRIVGGEVQLTLWQAMSEVIAIGDAFTITAGCDKRFETCRDRFANSINFRGFPHIPGNDFIIAGADASANNDGGSLIS
ncbi:DUF2163 domain-containing protein [[Pseudomonas] carboxydohydrogena]|uniref:DUF2163 domain-containing protein n=1 Tax=Afipia carboxydohydrogena TaxID=290 RepID=A0ABY8BKL8_AFICR|nr:DUF2163 domain-containing protein [[Pseudomonas] carboxydohydrogena]WEF50525.1 DUF2163 domain-containing protein [[Pseudomonas] carboxydohydrogena]